MNEVVPVQPPGQGCGRALNAIGRATHALIYGRPPNYEGSENEVRALRKFLRDRISNDLVSGDITRDGIEYAKIEGRRSLARTIHNGTVLGGAILSGIAFGVDVPLSSGVGLVLFVTDQILRRRYNIADLTPDAGYTFDQITKHITNKLPGQRFVRIDLSRASRNLFGTLSGAKPIIEALNSICCCCNILGVFPPYLINFAFDVIKQAPSDFHNIKNMRDAAKLVQQRDIYEYSGNRQKVDEAALKYGAIINWPDRTPINTNTLSNATSSLNTG